MKLKLIGSLFTAACCVVFYQSFTTASAKVNAQNELEWCHTKVQKSLETLGATNGRIDYTMIPRNIEGNSTEWHCRPAIPEEWCSGFWPGILWMDYAASGDENIRNQAELYTASMKPILDKPVFDHDLGFLFFCSYGRGLKLPATPNIGL